MKSAYFANFARAVAAQQIPASEIGKRRAAAAADNVQGTFPAAVIRRKARSQKRRKRLKGLSKRLPVEGIHVCQSEPAVVKVLTRLQRAVRFDAEIILRLGVRRVAMRGGHGQRNIFNPMLFIKLFNA